MKPYPKNQKEAYEFSVNYNFVIDPSWLNACGIFESEEDAKAKGRDPLSVTICPGSFGALEILFYTQFYEHNGAMFMNVATPRQPRSGWCVDARRGTFVPKNVSSMAVDPVTPAPVAPVKKKEIVNVQASTPGGADFFPYGHRITLSQMADMFRGTGDMELEFIGSTGDSIQFFATKRDEDSTEEENPEGYEAWSFCVPARAFVRWDRPVGNGSWESSLDRFIDSISSGFILNRMDVFEDRMTYRPFPVSPVIIEEYEVCQDCAEFAAGFDNDNRALDEHLAECFERERSAWGEGHFCEGSEEVSEFAWRSCDICNTTLGGKRFKVDYVRPNPEYRG